MFECQLRDSSSRTSSGCLLEATEDNAIFVILHCNTFQGNFHTSSVYGESTSMGITDLLLPTYTNPTSQMTTTFQTAKPTLGEMTEEFHTANEQLPSGNPCASSSRRKEVLTHGTSNESIKSTRGSSLAHPAPVEETSISPEQVKFTKAISKAMSKEIAPLIACREQTRTRPTVYKGTKDGNVDGWLLLMKRFLERVHTKFTEIHKAWAIFNHLEGEARSYIISISEPERDHPEKVFTF